MEPGTGFEPAWNFFDGLQNRCRQPLGYPGVFWHPRQDSNLHVSSYPFICLEGRGDTEAFLLVYLASSFHSRASNGLFLTPQFCLGFLSLSATKMSGFGIRTTPTPSQSPHLVSGSPQRLQTTDPSVMPIINQSSPTLQDK